MDYIQQATDAIEEMVAQRHPDDAKLQWFAVIPMGSRPEHWESTYAAWRNDARDAVDNFILRIKFGIKVGEPVFQFHKDKELIAFRNYLAAKAQKVVADATRKAFERRLKRAESLIKAAE